MYALIHPNDPIIQLIGPRLMIDFMYVQFNGMFPSIKIDNINHKETMVETPLGILYYMIGISEGKSYYLFDSLVTSLTTGEKITNQKELIKIAKSIGLI